MKSKNTQAVGFLFLMTLLLWSACQKQTEFDKKGMLEGIVKDYVLVNYLQLKQAQKVLKIAGNDFITTPTLVSLSVLQNCWKTSMDTWSKVEMLNFGPGRDNYRYLQLDNTPCNSQSIENAIAGTVLIDSLYLAGRSSYTKGFASIEYLLFDVNNNQQTVLNQYTNASNKLRRSAYLLSCIQNTEALIVELETEWKNSFGASISAATGNGTQEGLSSFSNVIIHIVQTMARKKLGKALGKEAADQLLHPEHLESLYAHYSWEIILNNLRGVKAIFGNKEKGLGSYLSYTLNNEEVTTKIYHKILEIEDLIELRSLPLKEDLSTNTLEVEQIYQELSELYSLLNSDMAMYFSITVLTNPDDGD